MTNPAYCHVCEEKVDAILDWDEIVCPKCDCAIR